MRNVEREAELSTLMYDFCTYEIVLINKLSFNNFLKVHNKGSCFATNYSNNKEKNMEWIFLYHILRDITFLHVFY